MLRSLPDQNEPLLHAESFLFDQQHRSRLALGIRPVRHTAPLQLSCHCRAQGVSLIDSWRADSESLSMGLARNYPMCEKSNRCYNSARESAIGSAGCQASWRGLIGAKAVCSQRHLRTM